MSSMLRRFLNPFMDADGGSSGADNSGGQEGQGDQSANTNGNPADNDQGAGQNQNQGQGEGDREVSFKQSQLTAMMTKEKNEGRLAVLKELGVTDAKTAKEGLEAYNKFLESQKTDLQKAQEAAKTEAENAKAEAAKATHLQQVFEVIKAGAKPDDAEDVVLLASRRVVEGVTDFKAAVELIKESKPSFFSGGEERSGGTGNQYGSNSGKGGGKAGTTGERLAKSRPQTKESSYFNKGKES